MPTPRLGLPNLGLGVGLRTVHYQHILRARPAVDWFEIISENYMDSQGRPAHVLDQIAERYPIVMHGVSLSIGSSDPLDFEYLGKLRRLAARVRTRWVSDHLCWTGVAGLNTHDLLPVPLTEESLRHVCERIRVVQEFLERPLVLENPSSYVTFACSVMPEWEYLSRMTEATGCGLLLDVNNVYVSSRNHDFDPVEYLENIPADRVVQCHLAGHTDLGTHCIDTHDGRVIDQVWDLYRLAHQRTGGVSTLLEWDAQIPSFEEVHAEVLRAEAIVGASHGVSDSERSRADDPPVGNVETEPCVDDTAAEDEALTDLGARFAGERRAAAAVERYRPWIESAVMSGALHYDSCRTGCSGSSRILPA
ncbi:MAG: DUF692 domain-containing protein [Planctomycetaceae bacterium]